MSCDVSQVVDSLLDVLVSHYVSGCHVQDIQRMELLVMQKLDFDLNTLTSLDFLKAVGGATHTVMG